MRIIRLVMALSSLLVSVLLILTGDTLIFTMSLMPLSMFISIVLGWNRLKKADYAKIPYFLYFFRDVVAIFFFVYSGYSSIVPFLDSYKLVSFSVLMISFENIFTLKYWNTLPLGSQYFNSFFLRFRFTRLSTLRVVFFGLVFLSVTWNVVPEIKANYSSVFAEDFARLSVEGVNQTVSGGYKRALLTLSLMFFDVFRLFVGLFLLRTMLRLTGNSLIRSVFFVMVVLLQLCYVTANTMMTVLVIGVLGHIFYSINTRVKNLNLLLMGVAFPILGILVVGAKISENSLDYLQAASVLLNSYVPGFVNLVYFNSLNIEIGFWEVLTSNLYTMIPFRHSLVGLDVGPHLMELFNQDLIIRGQVLPFLGEARYFLGLGYFILPSVFFRLGSRFWEFSNRSSDMINIGVSRYIALYFAITPVIYNSTIIGAFVLTVVPTWIMLNILRVSQRSVVR